MYELTDAKEIHDHGSWEEALLKPELTRFNELACLLFLLYMYVHKSGEQRRKVQLLKQALQQKEHLSITVRLLLTDKATSWDWRIGGMKSWECRIYDELLGFLCSRDARPRRDHGLRIVITWSSLLLDISSHITGNDVKEEYCSNNGGLESARLLVTYCVLKIMKTFPHIARRSLKLAVIQTINQRFGVSPISRSKHRNTNPMRSW